MIYPRVCPVCGRILAQEKSEKNPYICKQCYPLLHIPTGARCLRCSRPLEEDTDEFCPDCSRERRWFQQGISLLMHDSTAKKILYDLKYSNKRDNADVLAYEAAHRYARLIRHWAPDVIVPIPLYPQKERQRGFNQAALLAKRLSQFLEEQGICIPVDAGLLLRTRKTTVQKELNKYQRTINIKGAFAVRGAKHQAETLQPEQQPAINYPGYDPERNDFQKGDHNRTSAFPYRTVLLVDDIYTSGATLSEGARVLREAGVERVYFFTGSIG